LKLGKTASEMHEKLKTAFDDNDNVLFTSDESEVSQVEHQEHDQTLMMMTEIVIETSVQYVHLTRLIAREDYIKFTRRESTKTYIRSILVILF
jgi:hypothetical protein